MKYLKKLNFFIESKKYQEEELDYYEEIIRLLDKFNFYTLKKLIDSGVSINSRNDNGCTPLMYAAARERFLQIGELIQLGADIFATDNKGEDVIDYLGDDYSISRFEERLENVAPELYQEYLTRKEAEKYNL